MQNRYRTKRESFETGGLDWLSIFLFLGMIAFGWLAIYSVTYNPEFPGMLDIRQSYGRQLVFIGISLLLGIAILIIDAKFYSAFAYVFYLLGIILCISVIFIGSETKGAKSWFELGAFKFQPVELAKYATALALAKFLSAYDVSLRNIRNRLIALGMILLPMAIVLLQNDTGSALVFMAFILVLYREGLPTWMIASGFYLALLFVLALLIDVSPLLDIGSVRVFLFPGILVLSSLVLIFLLKVNWKLVTGIAVVLLVSILLMFSVNTVVNEVLQPHQKERINVLLGKGGDDYNVRQSKIAIGSGGLFGQGFMNGTQTRYDYVPEQSTDFIFCTVGEEYGFVGTAGVVLMFLLLMIRFVQLAERQKNKFSRIFAYSVACILFIHFTINIGMTIGLMPVIGIPLPFFSYGGSSLLGFTLLVFTLLKLDANRVNEIQSQND